MFPWYAGDCGNGMRVRMRLRTPNTMVLQYQHPRGRWQPAVDATRMSVMSSLQVPLMSRDPLEAVQNRMMSYHSFDVNDLQSVGWFVPPELTRDQWYSGLIPSSEPLRISASDVCWDPRFETVEDKSYYLTTFVGQPDGSLSEQLSNISDLLDGPFNGLCVHQVPTLPRMGKFTVGFVTGPSGSGKTTLARRLFGFPLEVEWASDVPVLGHFASLTRAREFCGAAQLDLHIAMRPFRSLSGGEQARAQVARLLHEGERRSRLDLGSRTPLLLEEFTSLMDRTTAKLLAREVQRLARKYKLQIVVLSCHRDFVAAGLMEPTWIFECDTNLLRRFRDMARPENRLQVVFLGQAPHGREGPRRSSVPRCWKRLHRSWRPLVSLSPSGRGYSTAWCRLDRRRCDRIVLQSLSCNSSEKRPWHRHMTNRNPSRMHRSTTLRLTHRLPVLLCWHIDHPAWCLLFGGHYHESGFIIENTTTKITGCQDNASASLVAWKVDRLASLRLSQKRSTSSEGEQRVESGQLCEGCVPKLSLGKGVEGRGVAGGSVYVGEGRAGERRCVV